MQALHALRGEEESLGWKQGTQWREMEEVLTEEPHPLFWREKHNNFSERLGHQNNFV